MLTLKFKHTAKSRLSGKKHESIIGVVASGNLEVLLERVLPGAECEVDIATPIRGYDETWKAVITEFVERGELELPDGGGVNWRELAQSADPGSGEVLV